MSIATYSGHGIDQFTHQYVHVGMSQELHALQGKPIRPVVANVGSVQQQTYKLHHIDSASGRVCAALAQQRHTIERAI